MTYIDFASVHLFVNLNVDMSTVLKSTKGQFFIYFGAAPKVDLTC